MSPVMGESLSKRKLTSADREKVMPAFGFRYPWPGGIVIVNGGKCLALDKGDRRNVRPTP